MKDRYSPEPLNSFSDMRAIARQEALAALQSSSSLGRYAPKSVPWLAVDLPLVTSFPVSPQDRDEVNLYNEDDGSVSRYLWSNKFNAWLSIGGGPTGTIGVTTLSTPPVGALTADGSAVTTNNPRLRQKLIDDSSPYGTSGGDPLLPDLRDKFIVGAGSTYSIGDAGGAATHTLTTAEMPSHNHSPASGTSFYHSGIARANPGAGSGSFDFGASAATTGSTGGGGAHNNLPPYLALTPFVWT